MRLIYLDESGNTGTNLNDSQQPVFVLAALVVNDSGWQRLERDLTEVIHQYIPDQPPDFEIHAQELRNGKGFFAGVDLGVRMELRDSLLQLAVKHELTIFYRAINKLRFKRWTEEVFGAGVRINPHVAAFPLVSMVVNEHLARLPGRELGIIVSDENFEVAHDVEKSLRALRLAAGSLRLDRIIERGFFINSRTSVVLQLCDLCAYAIRKHEEAQKSMKPIDANAVQIIQPLIQRGNEKLLDVIKWLTDERKKGATRD